MKVYRKLNAQVKADEGSALERQLIAEGYRGVTQKAKEKQETVSSNDAEKAKTKKASGK